MRWLEDKLNGREFEQGLRVGDGQGSLACCSPWGFRVGKEYVKALCFHPACLTYMQSTSCAVPGWRSDKLESRLPGEIPTISGMQMIPL